MPTFAELETMQGAVRRHRPGVFVWADGSRSGVTYDVDEDGERYATVGYTALPAGVYAEIEHGTCGVLQAFRVYLR